MRIKDMKNFYLPDSCILWDKESWKTAEKMIIQWTPPIVIRDNDMATYRGFA
jgi:hypothetical protein